MKLILDQICEVYLVGQETAEGLQYSKFKNKGKKKRINDRHLHNNVAWLFESHGGKVTHTYLIQAPTQTKIESFQVLSNLKTQSCHCYRETSS